MANFSADRPKTPPLPAGTTKLSHQVAGHVYGKSKTKYGFLQFADKTILKPLHEDERGKRELRFYEAVFAETLSDRTLVQLRTIMPAFYGTWTTADHPDVLYIHLEDVTKRFKKPCILDVKIGAITYDPNADADKIAREESKYPPLKTVGFQLIGLRVYKPLTHQYVYLDRHYLRKLDERDILTQGLAVYLNCEDGHFEGILGALLRRLHVIEDWFSRQKHYAFYASSLLLVYEGLPSRTEIDNSSCCLPSVTYEQPERELTSSDNLVDVRMIDFAHVFPSEKRDDNYLMGLRSLIVYLERLQSSSTEPNSDSL